MENASKALIIAGSILVSILLISIGVFIINSISGTQSSMEDTMGTQAIETFNSVYTAYVGSQSGSNVRSLLNKIATNNSKTPVTHLINVTTGGGTEVNDPGEISKLAAQIVSTQTYTITIAKYVSGYVGTIDITLAGATTGTAGAGITTN